MTPENESAYKSTKSKSLSGNHVNPAIYYLNGYQVCIYANNLLYSTNNFSNYTQKDSIYTMLDAYEIVPGFDCAAYGNNIYVFGLMSATSNSISIIYGNSLNGPFTKKQLVRLSGSRVGCNLAGITFINGYFYLVYYTKDDPTSYYVHVQKSSDCINWTDTIVNSGALNSTLSIPYYVNGLYYMSIPTSQDHGKIYSGLSIENMTIAHNADVSYMSYANGYLFVQKSDGVYYFKNPSESWTKCNVVLSGRSVSYGNNIYSSGDTFVYGIDGAEQSVPGTADTKQLLLYNGIGLRSLYTYASGSVGGSIRFSVIQPTLPAISSSGFYHYIKAK